MACVPSPYGNFGRLGVDGDIAAIDLNAVQGAVGGDVIHTGGADGDCH